MSRFITYPNALDTKENHTVILVDPTESDIEDVAYFLKVTEKDFDIYLYKGELYELEYLNHIHKQTDWTFIRQGSMVNIQNCDQQASYNSGAELLEYFKKMVSQPVDNATVSSV